MVAAIVLFLLSIRRAGDSPLTYMLSDYAVMRDQARACQGGWVSTAVYPGV